MHAQTEAGEPHGSLATRCEGDAVDAVADAPCIATQERGEAVREAEGRGRGSDRLQADASATTRSTRSTTERPEEWRISLHLENGMKEAKLDEESPHLG